MTDDGSPPLVSVLTPSYNQGKYLQDNIGSVEMQTGVSREHLVVDGGSTDNTVQILKENEDRYDLTWVSEPDQGQSHALNKALEMANGEWIGWQNADDYYEPDAFDHFVTALARNGEQPDVIYGDVRLVDVNGEEINRLYKTESSKFVHRYWSLFASNQATFIRREALLEIGGFEEEYDYCMDAAIFWKLLQGDYVLHQVPAVLGCFRRHDEAKTHDNSAKQLEEVSEIYNYSSIERAWPVRSALGWLAQIWKAILMARQRRFHALSYKFQDRISI